MQVEQILLSKMDTFCYIVGDEKSQTCALIDPAFDTDRILATVENLGLKVTHIINTHGHSDHCAGNDAIKSATGAQLMIHTADAEKLGKLIHSTFSRILGGKGSPPADTVLEDGDTVRVGETRLSILHTPGHTPGSICLYTPGHVFTGDTLFVQAVGRTDLPGGSGPQLIESVRRKIYSLPGDTIVWPGHHYGPTPSSTVQAEKETNPFTLQA
ncbi:MAG: MBL fold metallo-hydrolase [Deltaproteobacteria bacterium]|jgi:glyoxylase-like metal-dependent hydrolase (beta-lactamase superfamily II)|nr:MBL fold metallo-hydrolase [Deltaproteobacteria bacterium]